MWTPPTWQRDYRRDKIENVVSVSSTAEKEETNISVVTSYQGSDKSSEMSLTVSKTENRVTLNVLHSTLGDQREDVTERVTEVAPTEEVTEDVTEDVTEEVPEEVTEYVTEVATRAEEVTEEITEVATRAEEVTEVATRAEEVTEEVTEVATRAEEVTEDDHRELIEEAPRPLSPNIFSPSHDEDNGLNANTAPLPPQPNTTSRRARTRNPTNESRKERQRKIETGNIEASKNRDTIKRVFKNKVQAIARNAHEIHRKAEKVPNYLLLIEDSVHSKGEKNPRITAGKILTYGEGNLASLFLKGKLKFDRKKFFYHQNTYDTEEKIDFRELNLPSEVSQSDHETSFRDKSSDGSHGDTSSKSSTCSSENGVYQFSKRSKKDPRKEETKAKKAKLDKIREDKNKELSRTDLTESLPPAKRKSAKSVKKNSAKSVKKSSQRKQR